MPPLPVPEIKRPLISRRVKILFWVGATACLTSMVALFIFLVIEVHDLSDRINHDRGKNVATWCNAINADARRINSTDTTSTPLPLLPCQRLVIRTVRVS
jgi:hypothetical protein